MICYLIESRDLIFVKGYECLSFTKNMSKNIGKSMAKNLIGKYSQKRDHAKQSATDALITASKKKIIKKWEFYRDESFLDANGAIANFLAANNNSIRLYLNKK